MVRAEIFSIWYFINVVLIFQWPPAGDVFNHGLFTSVLINNGQYTLDLGLYYSETPTYPLVTGFHTLAAYFALTTGLLPGESVFLIGTFTACYKIK